MRHNRHVAVYSCVQVLNTVYINQVDATKTRTEETTMRKANYSVVTTSRPLVTGLGDGIELRSAPCGKRILVTGYAMSGPAAGRQLFSAEMAQESTAAEIEAEARYRMELD